MKRIFKNFPCINLPYEDVNSCKRMMYRLYGNTYALAELPLINNKDNTLNRTLENIPCLKENKGFLELNISKDTYRTFLNKLDLIYNSENIPDDVDKFTFSNTSFEETLAEMVKLNKSEKYVVIRFLGAFSLINMITNIEVTDIFMDKLARKFFIQFLTAKALCFIKKIKSYSENITPIIIFDEPLLYKYGTLKRLYPQITKDIVTPIFAKIFSKIQSLGGIVGVHSKEKCNWQLVLDAGVDIVSFDAYNNPNNLNIIAESINEFLSKGGLINWAVVPIETEKVIKDTTIDNIEKRLRKIMDELSSNGVHRDLLYNHSMVSVNGDVSKLPIFFAEKALILANQLSKRIIVSTPVPQD